MRDHYRATGLTERLKTALAALGPEDQQLTPQQLAALDQFHTRGLAATAALGKLAGVTAGMSVVDVGSGVGGPARLLAATCGCQVTGVDLSEPFVDAARYLTERTGQSGQVSYRRARRSRRQGCRAPAGSTRRAPAGVCAERDARGDDRRKLVSRFVSGYTSRRP